MTRRSVTGVLAAFLVTLAVGCGTADDAVDPLLSDVATARDTQALSGLQQALTSAALVRAESGGSYGASTEDLARRLQARDPSKAFVTGPSNGPDEIQVMGGGTGPVQLVSRSPSDSYLGVWEDGGGGTLYYKGAQPPPFTPERPAGAGWTTTPPR